MAKIFGAHLQTLDDRVVELRTCRPTFIRSRSLTTAMRGKPQAVAAAHGGEESRLLVQYELGLREPATGREWSQQVSGVTYAGDQTRSTWERLRGSDQVPCDPDSESPFAPYAYVPELDMLLQVFPHDHRLPALRQLMAGPPAEVEPLLLADFGPGDWRMVEWSAESVRYVVNLRATVRWTARAVDAASGRQEERRFYAKIYRDERAGALTYRALRNLWDRGVEAEAGFTVAQPIAYLDDLKTVIQAEAVGSDLGTVLRGGGDGVLPAVRSFARAIAGLHQLTDIPVRQSQRDDGARIQRVGEHLRSVRPELGSDIDSVVAAVVAGLGDVPLAPTHGDLKLAHILLDGDRVTLLDFDRLAAADPMYDVANFLSKLLKPRSAPLDPNLDRQTIEQAFIDEYFAHAPMSWRPKLGLHYAVAILSEASVLASAPTRDRFEEERVERLLRTAKDSVAGRLW